MIHFLHLLKISALNLLAIVCLAVLSFEQISGWLVQVAFSKHPQQCHPYFPAP